MTQTYRLGFSGTRHGMTPAQRLGVLSVLVDLGREHEASERCLHHGDCVGADAQAHEIARSLGWKTFVHPPVSSILRADCQGDFNYMPRPYLRRNRMIVEVTCELVAAPATEAPGDRRGGTWHTIGCAREAGKRVTLVLPDGSVSR